MRKVAVIFGGRSCENEISVLTGVFVARLLRERYETLPVYLHTDSKAYTGERALELDAYKNFKAERFQRVIFEEGIAYLFSPRRKLRALTKLDAAINCCHGGFGEGGGVAAWMERNGVPLASPDWTASGVFMDKCLTKVVMRGLGIPVLDYIRVNEKDYEKRGAFLLKNIATRLKFPVVVKPAHLGSSIGIAVARNEEEAKIGIENAFSIDDRVLIERYLEDKQDVNCAAYALNGEIIVSEAERAFGKGIYSFEEKYVKRKSDGGVFLQKGEGRYALNGDLREKIRAYTRKIYKRTNLRGVVRFDYLASGEEVYLCEVNTVPGSLAYYLFCERISDAKNLFSALIEEAIREKSGEKKILSAGILQNIRWNRK